jgi:hypothetical protein
VAEVEAEEVVVAAGVVGGGGGWRRAEEVASQASDKGAAYYARRNSPIELVIAFARESDRGGSGPSANHCARACAERHAPLPFAHSCAS